MEQEAPIVRNLVLLEISNGLQQVPFGQGNWGEIARNVYSVSLIFNVRLLQAARVSASFLS